MIHTASALATPIWVWLDGIDVTEVTVRASTPDLEGVEGDGWVDVVVPDIPASLMAGHLIFKKDANGGTGVVRRVGQVVWLRKPPTGVPPFGYRPTESPPQGVRRIRG